MGVNAPKKFDGTIEEAQANYRSHYFIDGRCADCDCRPFGRVASYPCGVEPPRVIETADPDYLERGFHVYAATGGVA
jgi:hypothetical protein